MAFSFTWGEGNLRKPAEKIPELPQVILPPSAITCGENNDLSQVPLATSGAGTAYPFGAHEFSPPPFLVGFVLLDL